MVPSREREDAISKALMRIATLEERLKESRNSLHALQIAKLGELVEMRSYREVSEYILGEPDESVLYLTQQMNDLQEEICTNIALRDKTSASISTKVVLDVFQGYVQGLAWHQDDLLIQLLAEIRILHPSPICQGACMQSEGHHKHSVDGECHHRKLQQVVFKLFDLIAPTRHNIQDKLCRRDFEEDRAKYWQLVRDNLQQTLETQGRPQFTQFSMFDEPAKAAGFHLGSSQREI